MTQLTKKDPPLIVSMTSYPPRFRTLDKVIASLKVQSLKADLLVLWINANDCALVPKQILEQQNDFFQIRSLKGVDLRSYKKLIPSLVAYPESIVVTADDDVLYYKDWLRDLYDESLRRQHACIICHTARRVVMDGDSMAPYASWGEIDADEIAVGPDVFPTGVGGILYGPDTLAEVAKDHTSALACAPNGDDIWFFFSAKFKMSNRIKIPSKFHEPAVLNETQNVALWKQNLQRGGNDRQIKQVERFFKNLAI